MVVLQIDFQQSIVVSFVQKATFQLEIGSKSVPSCTMGTASNIRNPSVRVMDLMWKDVKMELWDSKLRNSLHDSWFLNSKITIFSRICVQPFHKQEQCFLKVIWKSNVALSRESPSTLVQNFIPCLKSFPHLNKHESGKDVEKNYHQIWTYCMTMSNVILIYHYI